MFKSFSQGDEEAKKTVSLPLSTSPHLQNGRTLGSERDTIVQIHEGIGSGESFLPSLKYDPLLHTYLDS